MASFLGYLYLLLVLVAILLHADVVMAAENVNSTGFDVLEDVSNHINFEFMETIRKSDVYRVYFWGRYKNSPRTQEISQAVTHMAYVDSIINMVGLILFGPKMDRSVLRAVRDRELSLDDSQCLESTLELFNKHCGSFTEHNIKHMRSFANMCRYVVEKAAIEAAFIAICGINSNGPSVINIHNATVDVIPTPMRDSPHFCDRISVHGISRTKLQSYAKAYRLSLVPSIVSSSRWYHKIQICFHRNASLGLCQCEKNDWRPIQMRSWVSFMSPYEQIFVDVKFTGGVSGYVTATLDEVSQGWRYVWLSVGFTLLLSTRVVSRYTYYGNVDDWLAQFIRFATRVFAVTCIFMSSIDTPLAMVAVVTCLAIVRLYFVIGYILWGNDQKKLLRKKQKKSTTESVNLPTKIKSVVH